MDIKEIIRGYKLLGYTGKRGGIAHYQVVDDDEMDKIIADDAGGCGYSILDFSRGYNQGRVLIWASDKALIDECESIIAMYENNELPYCEDEEEKSTVIEEINRYKKTIDEIKNGKFFKFK